MRLLSNPYFLIGSLLAGVWIGLRSREATLLLSPIADLYVELLKMVLIPFMVSAVVVSFSRLFGDEMMRRRLGPIFAVFLSGLAMTSAFAIAAGVTIAPGANISTATRDAFGQVINRSAYAVDLEITLGTPPAHADADEVALPFVDHLIPDNIFKALTAGDQLKILFFAVAFGIALGSLNAKRGDGLRVALLSVYDVCTQLIVWVNLLLPVALCGMVARQVSTVGAGELVAMFSYTSAFCLIAATVCAGSVAVVSWASRSGPRATLRAMREPLLLALATRSSITCIPSATDCLTDGLGYVRKDVELLLPLGITLFRFGPVLYYAFTTVFVAQLYGIPITLPGYAMILVGAILTGLASAGTSGVLTISLLGVVFQPLGLPLEAALALLVTVDPVIDMFRTACIVMPNCAAVAVVYRDHHRPGARIPARPASPPVYPPADAEA